MVQTAEEAVVKIQSRLLHSKAESAALLFIITKFMEGKREVKRWHRAVLAYSKVACIKEPVISAVGVNGGECITLASRA